MCAQVESLISKYCLYTNASWITVIDGIQVAESAKYRSGKDVIFMKSYDNILENSALDYKKSFFVYDVTKVSTICLWKKKSATEKNKTKQNKAKTNTNQN
jgi:hypothetical protein